MDYIRSLDGTEHGDECFLCRYRDTPQQDQTNHVLWRGPHTIVVMNRFPYTNGHLLVAPARHEGDFTCLSDEELLELQKSVRDGVAVLRETIQPQGFNIGYNLGRCAGAGLPEHLHAHIVPRWSGDTNFMAILGDARVIPDSLDTLAGLLTEAARAAGLMP